MLYARCKREREQVDVGLFSLFLINLMMVKQITLEELDYPRVLIFQIKWQNGKYKGYRKTINDINHLNNSQNFYETRGGKCIGILDAGTLKNKEK